MKHTTKKFKMSDFCFLFLSKKKRKHFHMILFMCGWIYLASQKHSKKEYKKNSFSNALNSFISYSAHNKTNAKKRFLSILCVVCLSAVYMQLNLSELQFKEKNWKQIVSYPQTIASRQNKKKFKTNEQLFECFLSAVAMAFSYLFGVQKLTV